jgi:hypothetical protein
MTKLVLCTVFAATLTFGPVQAQDTAPPTVSSDAAMSAVAPPPDGKGEVIFFRPRSMGGAPYAFTIKDGDKPVTKLGNGRYFVYVVDPGEHEFKVRAEAKDSLFLDIDPGETYYVQQTMVMGAMFYFANLAPSSQAAFGATSLKPGSAAN